MAAIRPARNLPLPCGGGGCIPRCTAMQRVVEECARPALDAGGIAPAQAFQAAPGRERRWARLITRQASGCRGQADGDAAVDDGMRRAVMIYEDAPGQAGRCIGEDHCPQSVAARTRQALTTLRPALSPEVQARPRGGGTRDGPWLGAAHITMVWRAWFFIEVDLFNGTKSNRPVLDAGAGQGYRTRSRRLSRIRRHRRTRARSSWPPRPQAETQPQPPAWPRREAGGRLLIGDCRRSPTSPDASAFGAAARGPAAAKRRIRHPPLLKALEQRTYPASPGLRGRDASAHDQQSTSRHPRPGDGVDSRSCLAASGRRRAGRRW